MPHCNICGNWHLHGNSCCGMDNILNLEKLKVIKTICKQGSGHEQQSLAIAEEMLMKRILKIIDSDSEQYNSIDMKP